MPTKHRYLPREQVAGQVDLWLDNQPTSIEIVPGDEAGMWVLQGEFPDAPGGARGLIAPAAARAWGPELKILCVHGVGHHERDLTSEGAWRAAIATALGMAGAPVQPTIEFVAYDEFFAAAPLGPAEMASALWKLGKSGVVSELSDLFGDRSRGDFSATLRWTAGMVVQWSENEALQKQCRKAVTDHIQRFAPDLILAHSLGSLISYNTFSQPEGKALLAQRVFCSFGSQIGNAFVRSSVAFNGRIEDLTAARHWFHLFNQHDDAFTARLRLESPNFTQLETDFDIPGVLDHDANRYITHPRAVDIFWKAVTSRDPGSAVRQAKGGSRKPAALVPERKIFTYNVRPPTPKKRALLVGINDYPNPDMRLEGCVNDTFLISQTLQEIGFEAENIRVLLNDRATTDAISERLEWLLDGCQSGYERVFYYSGHGAQLPGYGADETIESSDECLVPWDFDWSLPHAITDNQFHDLYSQLPYQARFLTALDCCHSGGMARDGGMRVRGITPPDDIRHRLLKWNGKSWEPRFEKRIETEITREKKVVLQRDTFVKKLGRAADLRQNSGSAFKKACRTQKHLGPYMPVILEACQENQYAYEYRHGATPQGAFTWVLAETVKQYGNKNMSWNDLTRAVTDGLAALKYPQAPHLDGPSAILAKPITWFR